MKLFETVISIALFSVVLSMASPMVFSTVKSLEKYRGESKELQDNRMIAQSFRLLCRTERNTHQDFSEFVAQLEKQNLVSYAAVNCVGFDSASHPVMELSWKTAGGDSKMMKLLSVSSEP